METKQKNSNGSLILSLVSYRVFPAGTGGEKGIALFEQYLAKRAELVCVTVKINQPSAAKGLKVLNILSDSPLRYINPFYFFTLRKQIRKYNARFLLLEHPYYGWLGILLKWFTGIQLIARSHNIEAERWKSLGKWWWPIMRIYEKAVHRAADYNFFIQDDDRLFAIQQYGLKQEKCFTATYGIEQNSAPSTAEKQAARNSLRSLHSIREEETIFLFNGALGYKPNTNALSAILDKINPILLRSGLKYRIIICGRGLPAAFNDLKAFADKNIIYAGFVEDIDLYFKGADVFINPVIDGGGIKTKLVEALGWNTRSVSTVNGAIGVTAEDAGEQLVVVEDRDWESFAEEMVRAAGSRQAGIPDRFYEKFSWEGIIEKVLAIIRL